MAPTARRAAMAKTPISARNRGERGAALLEAALALALVALVAGAGLSAFGASNRASAAAEAKLASLALAENAIERGSRAAFLRLALEEGAAELTGDGWRLTAAPYADDLTAQESPLALLRLIAEAGEVTLETVRSVPR